MSGRRWWKWPIAVVLAVAVFALIVGIRTPGAFRAMAFEPLPIVHAARTRDGMTSRFDPPAFGEPTLIRVGPPPTPLSVLASCETDTEVLVFLYESLADLRMLVVDKTDGAIVERELAGVDLTYEPRHDRFDPGVAWIPTCQGATLQRYEAGVVRTVLELPDETHLFALDQHADGSLYLGTFPGRRCIRVRFDGDRVMTSEVEIDAKAIEACRYLRGVFAADDALFLHYMSPGVLVRYDLATRRTEVLHRSERHRLTFRIKNDRLRVKDGDTTLVFERTRARVKGHLSDSDPVTAEATDDGRVTWDGGTATFSLMPRSRGMSITALEAMPDGRVYGGTYWNTWMFRIDPAASTVVGLGPVPEGHGELFTVGWLDTDVAIPHYQGGFYRFDPELPYAVDGPEMNPRLAFTVPDAHFGRSCVNDDAGRLIYATTPNSHQRGGMLVVCDADGLHEVHASIGDDLTIDHLVWNAGALYAGTVERTGLGLDVTDGHAARPPRVVRVATDTGAVTGSLELDAAVGDDVAGLVGLPGGLLAATASTLHVIDTSGAELRATPVGAYSRLVRLVGGDTVALVPRADGRVMIMTERLLLVYTAATGVAEPVAEMPVAIRFATCDTAGNLWMADDGILYYLPAPALDALLDAILD